MILRFLSREDVRSLLPEIPGQLDLVEATYRSVGTGRVELPPKPGIHPRKDSFIHAMPAYLKDEDVAALKWVAGYPANKERGLPYISGLIVVNDAETGLPTAVMDGAEITAARTAAASGVCVRRWAPKGWEEAAILGCGEQGRHHARVLSALNPEVRIRAFDPHPERVAELEGRVEPAAVGTTVAVLSGGNVDAGLLAVIARRHETESGRRVVLLTRVSDRPGGLARLLGHVAATGANLVDVSHVREGLDLHVRETAVELVLETRGQEHATAIEAALEAAGYETQVVR